MSQIFISYSHSQDDWVRNDLAHILRGSGLQVYIDVERFVPGHLLPKDILEHIDRATAVILLFSRKSLASQWCQFEVTAALERRAKDPTLIVIALRFDDCEMPAHFGGSEPEIYVDMRDPQADCQWRTIIETCGGKLPCSPTGWLRARNDAFRLLSRNTPVNLITPTAVRTSPLVSSILARLEGAFGVADLQAPEAMTQEGLVRMMWRAAFASEASRASAFHQLVIDFQHEAHSHGKARLAMTHFDEVSHRRDVYSPDLWSSLRHMMLTQVSLVLLVQSHKSFPQLVPYITEEESAAMFETVHLL